MYNYEQIVNNGEIVKKALDKLCGVWYCIYNKERGDNSMRQAVIMVIETTKRTRYQVTRREGNYGFSAPLYIGKSEQAARDFCKENGLTVEAIGDIWKLAKIK